MMQPEISKIIFIGDSLSDRGTLWNCLPLRWLSELPGKSPKGRFSNGLVWTDHFATTLSQNFIIKEIKKNYHMDASDISDAVIASHIKNIDGTAETHNTKISRLIHNSFSLMDDLYIRYQGVDFVRSYSEGGLSAYNWPPNMSHFFKRVLLSNLEKMRKKLLDYDQERQLSDQDKASTLIIEWSGANDLITMNSEPSFSEVDKAVAARIENAKELMRHGYRHFVLFNLPDLAMTPRYQNRDEQARENAHLCTEYFNKQLRLACNRLKLDYPHCSFHCYDVNYMFMDIIRRPEHHKFDPKKVFQPYTTSADFYNDDGISAATGYIFWDDIHPTMDTDVLLGADFSCKIQELYCFKAPEFIPEYDKNPHPTINQLRGEFIKEYGQRLQKERAGFFGSFKKSNIDYQKASLSEIFHHALYEKGRRTKDTITFLQWIDEQGRVKLKIPTLEAAKMKAEVQEEYRLQAKR